MEPSAERVALRSAALTSCSVFANVRTMYSAAEPSADRQTLTTPETIRAYVHPTRLAILAILADRQETASGVAR